MPNESSVPDVCRLWREQEVESIHMSIDEIRRKARSYQRRIYRRNLREYIAGLLAFAGCTVQVARAGQPLVRISLLTLAAGMGFVLWRLLTRGAAGELPEELGRASCLAFHRRELERQRDLLRTVWRWYLGPFVPGLALLTASSFFLGKANMRWVPLAFAAFLAVTFWGIAEWNRRAADKLQRQIEEIAQWQDNSDPHAAR